ncbi:hypothetical protein T492DRAFT_840621 [Pavlovales sp. CCMP2436]|nr:hypothetical protein T492DRAFT_840621 [Pavlovales sp. CCMP2436]
MALVRGLFELLYLLICIRLKSSQVRAGPWAFPDELAARVAQTPDAPALVSTATGETLTFRALDKLSNQIAHWLIASGVRAGDVVVLVRHGCPRYVALWLGAAKAGAPAALVNPQVRGHSLLHSVRLALEGTPASRQLILCDRAALRALSDAGVHACLPQITLALLETAAEGAHADSRSLPIEQGVLLVEPLLRAQPVRAVKRGAQNGAAWSHALALIFTSGTTGLPKASRFSHLRCWMAGKAAHVLCRLGPSDRLYCALPLYHASGGMMGVSAALLSGCCVLIPPKFSASSFLADCAMHGATVVQYIGEMGRYIVAHAEVPPDPAAAALPALRLRVALGNGLQPALWAPFRSALGGARIVEFYASTEGNVNLFNNTGRPGAVGVVPFFAASIYPLFLARTTAERLGGDALEAGDGGAGGGDGAGAQAVCDGSLELARDARGLAVQCLPGEVGQLLGLISDNDPTRRFDGYTDEAATRAKFLRLFSHPLASPSHCDK